jgi:hypothetical protein
VEEEDGKLRALPLRARAPGATRRQNLPAKEIANDVGMANDDFIFVPRSNGIIVGRWDILPFVFQK